MTKQAELRLGVVIFLLLAALTAAEYAIATLTSLTGTLVAIAVVKALLILQFFMHLSRVTSGGGEH